MSRKRNDELAAYLYKMYESGMTLREVGEKTGRSNQAIHKIFTRRGLKLRNKKNPHWTSFNGKTYSKKPSGYYAATNRSRTLMHRDVWVFHNGNIPDGYQIHHKNGKRGDNDIDNLEIVERNEHARRHMESKMKLHICPHCGGNLV